MHTAKRINRTIGLVMATSRNVLRPSAMLHRATLSEASYTVDALRRHLTKSLPVRMITFPFEKLRVKSHAG